MATYTATASLESQSSLSTGLSEREILGGNANLNLNFVDPADVTGTFGSGNVIRMIETSNNEWLGIQGGHDPNAPQIVRSTDGENWSSARPTGGTGGSGY